MRSIPEIPSRAPVRAGILPPFLYPFQQFQAEFPVGFVEQSDLLRGNGLFEPLEIIAFEAEKFRLHIEAAGDKGLGFLVGQVMKRSHGRADPKAVNELLRRALS